MSRKAVIAAVISTLLFASTLGVLVGVAVFGVARVGDQMLEAINVLPLRWGETHADVLAFIAVAISVPAVAWFSWWFFRKAQEAETNLGDYTYTPPKQ